MTEQTRSPDADREPDAQELNRRGIARLEAGDAAGALAEFRRAAARAPHAPEPWNNAGLVRQRLGQLREAVADFDRALALRPDYPEALSNRGRARQALGDCDGARADFDRALAGATGGFAVAVLHNRGALHQERGDLAAALADYDRALALDPGHAATRAARGLARKESGDLDGALADFDAALEQGPDEGRATLYHGRGGVRALRNDFAGALADYDRALALDPERFNYYLSRGNARYHRRDPRALLDVRMAFRLDPDAAAREMLRILTTDARRDAAAVLENCTKHLRLSDQDVLAHGRRGLTLLLLGRRAEADADLARFRELAPGLEPYLLRVLELIDGPAGPAAAEAVCDAVFAGAAPSAFAGLPF
jgi:tetratricopeptide (TPR) repeat protein